MERLTRDPFVPLGNRGSGPAADDARARDSLFLAARLKAPATAAPLPVRVRNLSEGGLMAEVVAPLAIDMAVEVEVRGIGWIAGRVAWFTAGRAGIAFDAPIDPRLARRPVGAAQR